MARNALVTGAGGFIASHLCEALVEKGFHVRAMIRYNSRNFWGWLEHSPLKGEMEVVAADVRDYDTVRSAVKGRECVFHLAALIGIPYSFVSQEAYVDTNVKGTLNVLQACRDAGVQRIVHTSTSEVYGTAQSVPITEEHPISPQSPYAATKASADFLALSFHRSFGTPVTVIRPFNTFGPRQSARAIIPTIITQALDGARSLRLGNVATTRDFTFVKDTVEGFALAASSSASIGEVVNLGADREISMAQLAALIGEIMDVKLDVELDPARVRPGASEVERLRACAGKAARLLGWSPRRGLRDGLDETIRWFRAHSDIYKAGVYNV